MGPNFMDENDCGNFFDQIDDLIEFPADNECGGDGSFLSFDDSKDFPSMWNDPLPESDPLFSNDATAAASDLSAELSVPYEDILQLEWLSTFVEDSFSGRGLTIGKENVCTNKEPSPTHGQFQMSSPVSVLESSSTSSMSSCSGGKITPVSRSHGTTQRARSKRPRPATFTPRPAIQLISSAPSFLEMPPTFVPTGFSSESENFTPSPTLKKIPKPEQKKKKKKARITFLENEGEIDLYPTGQPVRKCLHCEITKTPQWRAGPMGPKTLCNACGVRYKSGRLYPEYRPAASPTFVPSLHSNSHKKVVEMRNKIGTGTITNPELVPNASVTGDWR